MEVGRLVVPDVVEMWVGVRAVAEQLGLAVSWCAADGELVIEGRLDHVLLAGLIMVRPK